MIFPYPTDRMPACRAAPSCDEYMNIVLQEMLEKENPGNLFFFFKKFLFRNNNNYNEFKNGTGSKIPKGARLGVAQPTTNRTEYPYRQICNLPEYKQTTGLQIRLDDKGIANPVERKRRVN